jgi:LuxR family quorum-sensing system transcriptional regulator SolR
MHEPVNFDSVPLDAMLSDWLCSLQEYAVEALVVLGPDPMGGREQRLVVAVHPPRLLYAATALAESHDFGIPWHDSDAPLVAWQNISKSALDSGNRWRRLWLGHGFQSVVRVEFALPTGRAFECFMLSPRALHDRAEAAALAWSALNIWPLLKRTIAQARSPLSLRECSCLELAFEGRTAAETALVLECSERTVNYYLASAMRKLKVDNKIGAIQRACWYGAI